MLGNLPILAKSNGREYSWHKYWTRKPSSLVGSYFANLLPVGGTVIDPCCGSGVALREAIKAGGRAIGIDVNPVACEISRVQVSPPDEGAFRRAANDILDRVEEQFGELYILNSEKIRFVIHQVIARCIACDSLVCAPLTSPRPSNCVCGRKISFSLENMSDTNVAGIQLDNGRLLDDEHVATIQKAISQHSLTDDQSYSRDLLENRRTLSFRQFSTQDFFTRRNFSLISIFLREIDQWECSEEVRRSLRLWITGTSAQLSRLTAWRNGLTTGGPAWTVPGFWVPPVHLECNPFVYLRSRIEKLATSFEAIRSTMDRRCSGPEPDIRLSSGLSELQRLEGSADIVFFDPPYGDSVAFTEFSMIWNGLLRAPNTIDDDISISDRVDQPFTAADYERAISLFWSRIGPTLRPDGRIVATFHNNDIRTWSSLVEGLQRANLRVLDAEYHDPAVISTKAQFSPDGSYIGDFYIVLRQSESSLLPMKEAEAEIHELLGSLSSESRACVTKLIAFRSGLEILLNRNVQARDFYLLEPIIEQFEWTSESYKVTLMERRRRLDSETSAFLQANNGATWRQLLASARDDKSRFVCVTQRELAETVNRVGYSILSDGRIQRQRPTLF